MKDRGRHARRLMVRRPPRFKVGERVRLLRDEHGMTTIVGFKPGDVGTVGAVYDSHGTVLVWYTRLNEARVGRVVWERNLEAAPQNSFSADGLNRHSRFVS